MEGLVLPRTQQGSPLHTGSMSCECEYPGHPLQAELPGMAILQPSCSQDSSAKGPTCCSSWRPKEGLRRALQEQQCKKRGGEGQALTDQDEDTDEQGNECSRAERGGHDVGRGVAGLDGPGAVTATDTDGEGPSAAECRQPTIHHQDGQQEEVLLLSVEARALHVHCGHVVCQERERELQGGTGSPQEQPHMPFTEAISAN